MGSIARNLVCHPASPAQQVESLTVEIERSTEGQIWIRYRVEGSLGSLVLPDPAEPDRTDGLWATTCFELFVRAHGEAAYVEFNFSPSSRWAAYSFDGYRDGSSPLDVPAAPDIGTDASEGRFALEATTMLPLPYDSGPLEIGLSAIIEETDGTKSYWALRHPPGKPDFHHPDCFALELAAPDRT